MWEFSKTVEGMRDALTTLQIPVVSGNVSFYNQGITKRIYPTPTIGMVGLGALKTIPCHHFRNEGICVAVLGETFNESLSSTKIPTIDLEKEQKIQKVIRLLIQNGLLQSVSSIDRGGLWVALVKNMIPGKLGITIEELPPDMSPIEFLFSESNSRYLISFDIGKLAFIQMLAGTTPVTMLGTTSTDCFHWDGHFDISWEELVPLFEDSFSNQLSGLL
jgi:phosphoribosylformylglycinamidine synthase